jgi:hypothetical protein
MYVCMSLHVWITSLEQVTSDHVCTYNKYLHTGMHARHKQLVPPYLYVCMYVFLYVCMYVFPCMDHISGAINSDHVYTYKYLHIGMHASNCVHKDIYI